MCGIAGILSWGKGAPPDPHEVSSMIAELHHRGPDETGVYLDDCAALGHARLAVIDLSTGTQPIGNEDGTLWIVYNGELYNYPELRRNLRRRGHRFTTHTDTEVLLHHYEEYGEAGLAQLNGQYAFAIWDRKRRRLFLARDPFGIRPLFYANIDGRFYFASELKAILRVLETTPQLDPLAWDDLFTFWTLLPGRTCFQSIRELPPGHRLSADDTAGLSLKRHWHLPFHGTERLRSKTSPEIAERVRTLLEDAVRIRLRADVPVGCYLSGGLDSAAITAITRDVAGRCPRTFGIRFETQDYDESAQQRSVAEFLRIHHDGLSVRDEDIASAFSQVIRHCEQPLLRTAPVPLYLLSQQVRQAGLKVVLTGEGADEVFAGYHLFKEMKVRRFWARQPSSECRPRLLERLYPYILNHSRLRHHLKDFFGRGLDAVADPFYSHRLRWANIARMKRLFSDDMRDLIGKRDPVEELAAQLPASFDLWAPLEQAQYLEMTLFMSHYLLSCQGDRMAMAHGVEVRMPYLDPRLVALTAGIPDHWKMPGLKDKALLRRAVADRLPAATAARPKQPYRAPSAMPLRILAGQVLTNATGTGPTDSDGIFAAAKVARLREKLQDSNRLTETETMALTAVISTRLLQRHFLLRRKAERPSHALPERWIDRRTETRPDQPQPNKHRR